MKYSDVFRTFKDTNLFLQAAVQGQAGPGLVPGRAQEHAPWRPLALPRELAGVGASSPAPLYMRKASLQGQSARRGHSRPEQRRVVTIPSSRAKGPQHLGDG